MKIVNQKLWNYIDFEHQIRNENKSQLLIWIIIVPFFGSIIQFDESQAMHICNQLICIISSFISDIEIAFNDFMILKANSWFSNWVMHILTSTYFWRALLPHFILIQV